MTNAPPAPPPPPFEFEPPPPPPTTMRSAKPAVEILIVPLAENVMYLNPV
jgi:hypothetical protein